MGEYDGNQVAFLLQNMFPITEKYLDHIHTRNNNLVPVKYSIQTEISTEMKLTADMASDFLLLRNIHNSKET